MRELLILYYEHYYPQLKHVEKVRKIPVNKQKKRARTPLASTSSPARQVILPLSSSNSEIQREESKDINGVQKSTISSWRQLLCMAQKI